MLTQPSTPVPLRLAKRIIAGIIITSSAYVAAATIHMGLEFGFQQSVRAELARVVSLTATPRANAAEKDLTPEKPAKPVWIKPAKGLNWGIIHGNNGVDIANKCGTSIVAAAAGTVVDIGSGWNGGYGNDIVIKHMHTKTRYAHLSEVDVAIGDKVTQGETIGLMGMTGKATGCHVHFEVIGGPNPFGK